MVATRHFPIVSAPRELPYGTHPVILQREDDDFVEAVLDELRTADGRTELASSVASARSADGTLKLFQPIQRRYHVALIESWCNVPGQPRIDPAKVEAAGMVLRRMNGNTLEGWMRVGGKLRGWIPVDRLGPDKADPVPAVRLAQKTTGNTQIDHVLRQRIAHTDPALLEEATAPMFMAPPDVCADARRTFFYGIVQTSSSELANAAPDAAAAFEGFGPGDAAFAEHLAAPLRGAAFYFPDPPNNDPKASNYAHFDVSWFETLRSAGNGTPQSIFLHLLRQVAVEFDAFGNAPESAALFAELEGIKLTCRLRDGENTPRTTTAGSFLKQASALLLERDPDAGAWAELPQYWPALETQQTKRLLRALSAAMRARFTAVKGRPGRFDAPNARYVLRAFVRLKPEGKCPPKTLWSDYSEPFVIAPWYEGGGTPAQIPMPDISDRGLLKSLKPNVSFLLPPKLHNMLGGDPKKMMEGKFDDSGPSLGWICSFSIPMITICAFIALNILLTLFDLFLGWMFYFKICIPFPKFKGGPS